MVAKWWLPVDDGNDDDDFQDYWRQATSLQAFSRCFFVSVLCCDRKVYSPQLMFIRFEVVLPCCFGFCFPLHSLEAGEEEILTTLFLSLFLGGQSLHPIAHTNLSVSQGA